MNDETRLRYIRESERRSHEEMYSNEELFQEGSWLRKPIKTILELIPLFEDYKELNILDLGCGVGRNCIPIAQHYSNIMCSIDCVDILELAIVKLGMNAIKYDVSEYINGVVNSIEDYLIRENYYDLVIAVSALEHIDSKDSCVNKLKEISTGIREGGIVCLVINSDVQECDKLTGEKITAQFEVNLSAFEVQELLRQSFAGWKVIKSTVREQQYDIPREERISELKTRVVTYVARKQDGGQNDRRKNEEVWYCMCGGQGVCSIYTYHR